VSPPGRFVILDSVASLGPVCRRSERRRYFLWNGPLERCTDAPARWVAGAPAL